MKPLLSLVALFCIFALLPACSPSQDQVDKAVEKEMKKREEEKARIFKYIDEYVQNKGAVLPGGGPRPGAPGPQAAGGPPPSFEEGLKNPKTIEIGDSPVKGSRNAKVTIVEFSDFQCPYCSRVVPTLQSLMKKYQGKIKIVFKNQPLPFHPNARPAAKAAMAAHKQGKFWEMHDLLFANQDKLDEQNLIGFAKKLGLNEEKFKKDMDDPKINERLDEEFKWANANGLGGTPSFLINGATLVGAQPEEQFSAAIDKALAAKK